MQIDTLQDVKKELHIGSRQSFLEGCCFTLLYILKGANLDFGG